MVKEKEELRNFYHSQVQRRKQETRLAQEEHKASEVEGAIRAMRVEALERERLQERKQVWQRTFKA